MRLLWEPGGFQRNVAVSLLRAPGGYECARAAKQPFRGVIADPTLAAAAGTRRCTSPANHGGMHD